MPRKKFPAVSTSRAALQQSLAWQRRGPLLRSGAPVTSKPTKLAPRCKDSSAARAFPPLTSAPLGAAASSSSALPVTSAAGPSPDPAGSATAVSYASMAARNAGSSAKFARLSTATSSKSFSSRQGSSASAGVPSVADSPPDISPEVRDKGVAFAVSPTIPLDDVFSAIFQVLPGRFISHASRIEKGVQVYYKDKSHADLLALQGFNFHGQHINVKPVALQPQRVVVSNAPPEISNSYILQQLNRYGRVLGNVQTLHINSKHPELQHVLSFRRTASMVFASPEEEAALPRVVTVRQGGFTYTMYITVGVQCFACRQSGHVRSACPNRSAPVASSPPVQDSSLVPVPEALAVASADVSPAMDTDVSTPADPSGSVSAVPASVAPVTGSAPAASPPSLLLPSGCPAPLGGPMSPAPVSSVDSPASPSRPVVADDGLAAVSSSPSSAVPPVSPDLPSLPAAPAGMPQLQGPVELPSLRSLEDLPADALPAELMATDSVRALPLVDRVVRPPVPDPVPSSTPAVDIYSTPSSPVQPHGDVASPTSSTDSDSYEVCPGSVSSPPPASTQSVAFPRDRSPVGRSRSSGGAARKLALDRAADARHVPVPSPGESVSSVDVSEDSSELSPDVLLDPPLRGVLDGPFQTIPVIIGSYTHSDILYFLNHHVSELSSSPTHRRWAERPHDLHDMLLTLARHTSTSPAVSTAVLQIADRVFTHFQLSQ